MDTVYKNFNKSIDALLSGFISSAQAENIITQEVASRLKDFYKSGKKSSIIETSSKLDNNESISTSTTVSIPIKDNYTRAELNILTKKELGEICKSKGLKITGTKPEIIQRIVEIQPNNSSSSDTPPIESGTGSKDVKDTNKNTIVEQFAKVATKTKQILTKQPDIIQKIKASVGSLEIIKNKYGNFEHTETNLVFQSAINQKVIGKQMEDGTLADLTPSDIETCKLYKFSYNLPMNLDSKIALKDVKVAELDNDADDDNNESDQLEVEEEVDDIVAEDLIDDEVEEDYEYEEEIVEYD